MQPFNYTTQVANPIDAALRTALQAGQLKQQQQAQQVGAMQIGEMEQQQAARLAQREQQVAMQEELRALGANPTPQAVLQLMTKYPMVGEKLDPMLKALNVQAGSDRITRAQQVYAAALSGDTDIAEQILTDEIAAYRESGLETEAKMAESRLTMLQRDPKGSAAAMGMFLARAMGPEKFSEAFRAVGSERRADELQPDAARKTTAEAAEAESKATSAAVAAKYAESNAAMELKKAGWEVTKLQNDVQLSRLNQQIATAQAQLNKEMAPFQRREAELRVEALVRARDESTRTKAAEVQTSMANIDNMINTIEAVLKDPALDDVLGAIEGSEFYPTTAAAMAARTANLTNPFYTPTSADDRMGVIARIDQLISQSFTTQLEKMRGLGHLSNVEGQKIQEAFQTFRRRQGEANFRENADEARRLLTAQRETIAKKYGVPTPPIDAPSAPGARPPLDSFDR